METDMPECIHNRINKARWFIAGMGTVLSVAPMTVASHPTVTSAERLANATNRVGAHFNSVLKQGQREQKKEKGR